MTWTQPLCLPCWTRTYGDREPCRVRDVEERCCECGAPTLDGIWARRDPKAVAFPRQDEEER